jgi:hypothetical protein
MRYAQGGGLTDERRAFREKLRMEASERFALGDENAVIAHELRVSVRSVASDVDADFHHQTLGNCVGLRLRGWGPELMYGRQ